MSLHSSNASKRISKILKYKTYGECLQAEAESIQMINGTFQITLQLSNKPKRMPRDEALKYYTQKLQMVWAKI